MTFSNYELVDRFKKGETKGKAANMEIKKLDNGTVLIGYGWATYAFRRNDSVIFKFNWHGLSCTTTTHMGMIPCDYIVYDEPSTSDFDASDYVNLPDDTIKLLKAGIVGSYELNINNHVVTISVLSNIVRISVDDESIKIGQDRARPFIDVIAYKNNKKIEFIKELSRTGLCPSKHTHFDYDRLKQGENVSEYINEYSKVCEKARVDGSVINVDGYTIFFPMGIVAKPVLAIDRTGDCYAIASVGHADVPLGKVIKKRRMTKSLRDNMVPINKKDFLDHLLTEHYRDTPEATNVAVKLKLEED